MSSLAESHSKAIRIGIFVALAIVVFVSCFYFFHSLHPYILYDTDDWYNISVRRLPIPDPEQWNPIKVTPEILGPICASLANRLLVPITGDFIQAITLSNALVLAVFTMAFILLFALLLEAKFNLESISAAAISLLFYVTLFWVLISQDEKNVHMLWSLDMCSMFHYILPNLLCASIVLYLSRVDLLYRFFSLDNLGKKVLLIMALYFGLCSSLFSNIIITAYLGSSLIVSLIDSIRKTEFKLGEYLTCNAAKLIVILFWLALLWPESHGRRAQSLSQGTGFLERLQETIATVPTLQINLLFALFAAAVLVAFIVTRIRTGDSCNLRLAPWLISIPIIGLYLILLCTSAGAYYIVRPNVFFCIYFPMVSALFFCFAYVIKGRPLAIWACVGAIVIAIAQAAPATTFRESNMVDIDAKAAIGVSQYIVKEIEASKANEVTEIKLHVPANNTKDNFPLALYGGGYIIDAAHQYGLSDDIAQIAMVPDGSLNERFGIGYELVLNW